MVFLKVLLVFAFAHSVFSEQILKQHCKDDSEDYLKCVEEVVQDYFRKHSEGFPEHNFKAVDPITVPEIIDEDKLGLKATFRNIKITGFKDVVISDVKIFEKEGQSTFTMKFDMVAEGDVISKVTNGKTYTSAFKYEGSVKADSKQSFTQKKTSNDVIFYDIGPETITCEASNIKDHFDQELVDAFANEPENQSINNEFQNNHYAKVYNERIVCKMATVVFKEAVDILRAMGQKGV